MEHRTDQSVFPGAESGHGLSAPRLRSVHRAAVQCRCTLEARMHRIDNHALARGARIQYAALTNPMVNDAVTGILWLKRYVH